MADSKSSRSTGRAQVLDDLRRQQARRQRTGRLLMVAGVLVAVLILVVVIAAVGLNRHRTSERTTAARAAVVSAVTGVPAATLDTVGVGSGSAAKAPRPITASPLTAAGLPRVLYVGAEYCPYCAAERWPFVVAMSRFGTFHGLGQTASSADDVYPSTPTLSFHGASYTSSYLSFTGAELQSNQRQGDSYAPLDKLDAADTKVLDTYDTQKYTGAANGGIPFLDLGGTFVSSGSSYDPQLLHGLTHAEVAHDIGDPKSKVGQAILGSANLLTARLCTLTGGRPASVCTSSGVTAAAAALK